MKRVYSKFKEFGADLALVSVAVSWGATFIIVQDAIKDVPVFSFLFMRFFLSFLLMALFSIKYIKELSLPLIKAALFLGTLFFLGYASQTYALVTLKSSIVAFITGLNVIIVPIVVYLLFRQKVLFSSLIGAIIAAIGLWMLTGAENILDINRGEIYALACATFFAVHIVYTAKLSKEYSVFLLVTVQLFVVSILALFASIFFDPYVLPKNFSPNLILALVTTVIFATVYALFVQTYMQQFTTPAKAAIIFTMEPVSAAIFSYYYAGETLNILQIAGGALMISAMLISEIGSYYKRK